MRIPETLRQRMYQQQCLAFVGAGFSMVCGMPSWRGLLEKLYEVSRFGMFDDAQEATLEQLRDSIARNQLLLAVSLVRQILSPVDLNDAIARLYDLAVFHGAPTDAQERMLERLKNLANGPWAGIITTNYDNLIEHGLGKYTRGNYLQTAAQDDAFGAILCSHPANRFFVKLHGSVRGAGYVLGTEEYDRVYLSDPRVRAFLTAAMLSYHIVFIGCSLEDEILRLRRQLCLNFGGHIPQAYAVLPGSPENLARRQWLIEQAKIVPLTYPVVPRADGAEIHFALDEFLKEARAGVDPVREADVRAIPGSAISTELQSFSLRERLQKIGSINQELLIFIKVASKEHGIAHSALLAPEGVVGVRCPPSLRNLSPNERIYRVLFLASIRLLEKLSSPTGEPHFRLSVGVAEELATLEPMNETKFKH